MELITTPKERLKIYKLAKERIERGDDNYVCDAISDVVNYVFSDKIRNKVDQYWFSGVDYYLVCLIHQFPEFKDMKPTHVDIGDPWWPKGNVDARLVCLDDCIEEVKQLIE